MADAHPTTPSLDVILSEAKDLGAGATSRFLGRFAPSE